MKSISFWAKKHIWQSRLLIIIFWLLLNITGIFIGKQYAEINIHLPEYYCLLCIFFITVLCIIYPRQNSHTASPNKYFYRKLCDTLLAGFTFIMIIYTGNNEKRIFERAQNSYAASIISLPGDTGLYNHPLMRDYLSKLRSSEIKSMSTHAKMKLIKRQLRSVRNDKEITKVTKALLIGLSVLAGFFLIIGVAALSCSLACSGSEGMAYVVAFGGTFLIIFFLVKLIKHISKMKIKDKQEEGNNIKG